MKRLTKKNELGGYYSDYCGPEKQPEIQKLGKLEDIMERFGIETIEELESMLYERKGIIASLKVSYGEQK